MRVAAAACALLLSGCAAMLQGYKLTGSPESAGLAVIECDVRIYGPKFLESFLRTMSDSDIAGGDPMPVSGARLSVQDQATPIEKDPVRGLVVFDNLAPGRYRLERVTADPAGYLPKDEFGYPPKRDHYLYPVGAQAPEELTFEIRPGMLRYLGKIVVLEPDRPRMRQGETFPDNWQAGRHEFVLVLEADAERATWRKVLVQYSKSSWTEAIRRRVQELEARAVEKPRLLRWNPR